MGLPNSAGSSANALRRRVRCFLLSRRLRRNSSGLSWSLAVRRTLERRDMRGGGGRIARRAEEIRVLHLNFILFKLLLHHDSRPRLIERLLGAAIDLDNVKAVRDPDRLRHLAGLQ